MLRNGWLFPNIPDADADAQQQYKLIFMDIYICKNIAIQVKKSFLPFIQYELSG